MLEHFELLLYNTLNLMKITFKLININQFDFHMTTPNIEQFMIRKERHRKMIQSGRFPKSDSSRFIVPCFQRSFGFRTNQYVKNLQKLQDYIDKITFQKFVRSANRIIDTQLMEKSKNQNATFFCMTSLYLKLSIVLGILTFTILSLIVYLDFQPKQQEIILDVSVVLIIFSVVIASICPIYLYLRKYVQYDYEAIIKQKLDKLAKQQNSRYKQQGLEYLRWTFQKSFFWIELQFDHSLFQLKSRKFVHRDGNDTPPLIQ